MLQSRGWADSTGIQRPSGEHVVACYTDQGLRRAGRTLIRVAVARGRHGVRIPWGSVSDAEDKQSWTHL